MHSNALRHVMVDIFSIWPQTAWSKHIFGISSLILFLILGELSSWISPNCHVKFSYGWKPKLMSFIPLTSTEKDIWYTDAELFDNFVLLFLSLCNLPCFTHLSNYTLLEKPHDNQPEWVTWRKTDRQTEVRTAECVMIYPHGGGSRGANRCLADALVGWQVRIKTADNNSMQQIITAEHCSHPLT